jgi:release factor glutamine methyltransferase
VSALLPALTENPAPERPLRIVVPPGVFRPRSDTWVLARLLADHTPLAGSTVLDVCTGSGAIAVAAAKGGARRVTAVDVSRRAVVTARVNARLNGTRVRALRGDLFGPVQGQRFDTIVSNPPYLPAHDDKLPTRGEARAWDAGRDGRALIDRIADEAPPLVKPGGRLLLIQSSLTGTSATLMRLEQAGFQDVEVVFRRRGPLGPLLTARAEELERRGVLREGEREEELVAIRGRRGPGA